MDLKGRSFQSKEPATVLIPDIKTMKNTNNKWKQYVNIQEIQKRAIKLQLNRGDPCPFTNKELNPFPAYSFPGNPSFSHSKDMLNFKQYIHPYKTEKTFTIIVGIKCLLVPMSVNSYMF